MRRGREVSRERRERVSECVIGRANAEGKERRAAACSRTRRREEEQ